MEIVMLTRLLTVTVCAQTLFLGVALVHAETARLSQEATHDQNSVTTLRVLVLDHDHKPVTDLSKNELELNEGKEEQPIESLTISPTASANIGILIDVSPSYAASFAALKVQNGTDLAGELLHTGDLAFVAAFAHTGALLSQPTTDFGQVEKALERAFNSHSGQGSTSLYDAMFWACTEELPPRSGHQALIIFSDMVDNASSHTREEVLARVQRSGIGIYPVLLREADGEGEKVAKSFADETGGLSFVDYNLKDLEQTLRAIRSDLDNRYVISYRPKSQAPASVKIRCTRKGVKIVAPDRRY
jgi:VWFA-related protein